MININGNDICSVNKFNCCPETGYSALEILICLAFIGITASFTASMFQEQMERRSIYSFSSKLSQALNGAFETVQYRGADASILKSEYYNSFIIISKGKILLVIDAPKRHLTKAKIFSSISSREEIKIQPNGYCTPGRIELASRRYLCVIRISIRGRVTNTCSKK